jgi:hypothetical protein
MDRVLVTLNFDSTQLTLPTLSFCVPTAIKIKEWADELPIANRSEAARQLYHALHDLNHLNCNASTRYSLLDVIRPLALQVSDALARNYLTKNVSLNEQQRKVANITQAINKNLASAYRLVVKQYLHDKKSSDKKYLAQSIYRSLQCASYSLLSSQQLYISPADGFWLEFNELFSLAERLKLVNTKIDLEDSFALHLDTIRAVYATTLLFYTCKPAQLRQSEQQAVYKALPNWSHFVSLHSPAREEDLFVIRLDKNMPPIYQSFFDEARDEDSAGLDVASLIKGFNASGLVESLKQKGTFTPPIKTSKNDSFVLEMPSDIDHALLTHLVNTWGIMAIRTAERKNIEGNISICIGLTATHYYLSGMVGFDEQMQIGSQSAFKSTERNQFLAQSDQQQADKNEDEWSDQQNIPNNPLYDTDVSKLAVGMSGDGKSKKHEHPIFSVSVINISATGCCLQFKTLPPQLQSGEIIGVQSEARWRVGAIRWVRHVKNEGIQIGVEFLGTRSIPCGAKLLHKSGETSAYMRTLLLAVNNLETLITPRVPFKEGSKVYLKIDDTERRVNLSPLIAATGGFCQFKFNYINELPT